MRFLITKFYLRGPKNGEEEEVILKFSSLEAAEKWAYEMSDDPKNDFAIIMVRPILK